MKKALLILGLPIFLILTLLLLQTSATAVTLPAGLRPTPTIQPPGPPAAPGAGPLDWHDQYPDLIVESISTDPTTPMANVSTTIKVVIKNTGQVSVTVGNNFYVDLYVNPAVLPIPQLLPGDLTWGVQSWWVQAGQSYELTATYRFTDTRTYVLYAQIDTDNSVVEADEYNNVTGPVQVTVRSSGRFRQSTHQDFQYGLASNLDVTHPDGVIRLGDFAVPETESGTISVYTPDAMINDITGTVSAGLLVANSVAQVRPSLVVSDVNHLYAVWQDGRHGSTTNNRIYSAFSTNQGITWSNSISITPGIPLSPSVNQLAPRLAYDGGRLYAVWQDNRSGNYDIHFATSTNGSATWTTTLKLNDDLGSANQMNPSLAVNGSEVYVAWQDQRNGNDDIYFARSHDFGATWPYSNTFVSDDPDGRTFAQRNPSIGLGWYDHIYIAWEDWRNSAHPEVYVARSEDHGATFGIDVPVDIANAGQSYRVAPVMVVSATTNVSATARLDVIHLAWQEGEGDNADIYYAWSWHSYNPVDLPNQPPPNPYDFFFRSKLRIDGYFVESDYALPPEGKAHWDISSTWQGEISLAKTWGTDIAWCEAISYTEGVYIAWSDGRSFDLGRRDIFVARVGHKNDAPTDYAHVCHNNNVLNDNARLYAYRNDAALYERYKPATVRQSNPSIAAGITGTVYLAWDDDRWDTPFSPGTRRNRDVFFARSGQSGDDGVYISPVLDAKGLATWYTLDWWGVTDHGTPIYFQTRTGNTPQPPMVSTYTYTATGWYQWQGPGLGNLYDAPGQDIVSPPARYIQYKLIIRGPSHHTAVSQVTINYDVHPFRVYLPAILKNYGP